MDRTSRDVADGAGLLLRGASRSINKIPPLRHNQILINVNKAQCLTGNRSAIPRRGFVLSRANNLPN
jgi:hypothetical protein